MFKAGQKVVCVKVTKHRFSDGIIYPVKDKIYTIRDTEYVHGIWGCWLEEIRNKDTEHQLSAKRAEYGFLVSDFREVNESFAEEVLENIKEQIEEEQLVTA